MSGMNCGYCPSVAVVLLEFHSSNGALRYQHSPQGYETGQADHEGRKNRSMAVATFQGRASVLMIKHHKRVRNMGIRSDWEWGIVDS